MRAVNRDSMSTAYVAYLTYCVNASKDAASKDLTDFLPFPKIAGNKSLGKKLHVSASTKAYLKQNFSRLPLLVQVALEQYKADL